MGSFVREEIATPPSLWLELGSCTDEIEHRLYLAQCLDLGHLALLLEYKVKGS